MPADTLLKEVQERQKKALDALQAEYAAKMAEVKAKAEEQRSYIMDSAKKEAEDLSQKEAARIHGAAKLEAKKVMFDATGQMLDANISALKEALGAFVESKEYHKVLTSLYGYASKKLGKGFGVRCRSEDATFLKRSGAKVLSSNLETMGGFKAEAGGGDFELDLTFEEILRSREEDARAAILGKA